MNRQGETGLTLWTWQSPDWDITRQCHDSSRMEEAWGKETADRLRPHYERLYKELGTENFLFCFTRYAHWAQLEIRRLWKLHVPTSGVFQYQDSDMWESLVQSSGPKKVSKQEAWSSMFLDPGEALCRIASDARADKIVPLLRVPVPAAWVCDRQRFNKGPRSGLRANYENLPTSENAARRFRD